MAYGGYNRYGSGYGMYNSVPIVRTYQEQVVVVQVDLFDAGSGQPVWSASAETAQQGQPERREPMPYGRLWKRPCRRILPVSFCR